MVDITTINPGTVFAWFMLVILLRRMLMILIFNLSISKSPPKAGTRVPEDFRMRRKRIETATTEIEEVEYPVHMRVNKTITNDSENDAYFLILLLATASFSDRLSGTCVRTIVYGVIYLSIRICYAVAYIVGLQPWRTILFAMGLTCTIACNLDLVITMSRSSN